MCIGNTTSVSRLTFTLCGVPKPSVSWGFLEKNIKNSINATERNDVHYAHDYSLLLNDNMCGKAIYFKAVGYNNETFSWNTTHGKKCKLVFYLQYHGYYII